ncbi:hypothetical protein [Micromonospora okii]|uniref:hypothetical protein n=1 Tax=Micromonospora okii TaxID=1182970 RepID=UPI001E5B367E|nr:hypothetical protein [Micromonospora okii]
MSRAEPGRPPADALPLRTAAGHTRRPARPLHRLALAVGLAVAVAVAGCGGDRLVSPLPVQPASAAVSAAPGRPPASAGSTPPATRLPPTPPAAPPTSRRPPPVQAAPARTTRTPPAAPSPSGLPTACQGAVRYELVLAETELALVPALCFATGAVLRIRGIGPGEVTVDREDLVSRSYEAGVVDIRFVRPGTVTVLIPQEGTTYPVTVVVRG